MSDFDPHITIDEQTNAKDIKCVVKDIIIDTHRIKIETPVKVLSGNSISGKTAESFLSGKENPFFEFTKAYTTSRNYDSLINILEIGGKNKDWTNTLDDSLNIRRGLQENFKKNITLSAVFGYYPLNDVSVRNPSKDYQKMTPDLYQNYLDYVYSASSAFILTPDVLLSTQSKRQITIHEYLNFIEFSVESLEIQNRKPIFVPIQIDLASKDLKTVLELYKMKGYSNIWINFKAKSCNRSNAAKLRTISRLISEYLGNDAVIYCSQLKRERDVKQTSIPAYDILPPLLSADFLGVNRTLPAYGVNPDETAKRKGFSSTEEYNNAQNLIKQSLFNPDTYSYCLPSSYPKEKIEETPLLFAPKNTRVTDFINGILIDKELAVVKQKIHDTEKIFPYLEKKDGVKKSMSVFENISADGFISDKPTSLDDFF